MTAQLGGSANTLASSRNLITRVADRYGRSRWLAQLRLALDGSFGRATLVHSASIARAQTLQGRPRSGAAISEQTTDGRRRARRRTRLGPGDPRILGRRLRRRAFAALCPALTTSATVSAMRRVSKLCLLQRARARRPLEHVVESALIFAIRMAVPRSGMPPARALTRATA